MFWKKFVVVFSITILISAGSASAAATTTLEDATVNLYCRVKSAGRMYNTTGSGIFVHESGVILTNAHVGQYFLLSTSTGSTKAECGVRLGATAKEKYKAELIYLSSNWAQNIIESTQKLQPQRGTGEYDFALLRVIGAKKGKLPEKFPALPNNVSVVSVKEKDTVSIAGYPAENLTFKEIQQKLKYKTTQAEVSSVQSFLNPLTDLIVLSSTELGAPGVSGGPIALSDQLVGIAVTISGANTKGNRSLRAITLSYIDRAMRMETGASLWSFISAANPASVNPLAYPYSELKKTIEKTFRNTKE